MKGLIAMLSLVTLLSAYPALAERPHGGPPPGGLLERLIDVAAEDSASGDVQNYCSPQIQAAQSACVPNHHASQPCQGARRDLHTCAQPYLTQLRSAVRVCRNTAETCTDACDSRQ